MMQFPTDDETLSRVCHVRIHVDFFIYDSFFGSLGLHLLVRSELGWSQPFQPMRDLRAGLYYGGEVHHS